MIASSDMTGVVLKAALFLAFITSPFHSGAQVAVASVKMNVLYIGIDNPLRIAVSGYLNNQLEVGITNGTIRKDGDDYIVRVPGGTEATVTVYVKKNGRKKEAGNWKFRVKRIPDPIPYAGGKKGEDNTISRGELAAIQGVLAKYENLDFDVRVSILNFHVLIYRNDSLYESIYSPNNRVTPYMTEAFSKVNEGDVVKFVKIRTMGPDSIPRPGMPIEMTVKPYKPVTALPLLRDSSRMLSDTINRYNRNMLRHGYHIEALTDHNKVAGFEEGSYDNGKRVGVWKSFTDTWKLSREEIYENGQLVSRNDFDMNEKPMKLKSFRQGKLYGKYEEYHNNGQVRVSGNYALDTIRIDSVWIEHRPKDSFTIYYTIREVKEGLWKEYDAKGKLVKETLFRKDEEIEVKKH
jgi:hypothetical protein